MLIRRSEANKNILQTLRATAEAALRWHYLRENCRTIVELGTSDKNFNLSVHIRTRGTF